MARIRSRVRLEYIQNDAARRASLKKRRKGLIKKVSEFSTLCGVDACAIIKSPGDPELMMWPNSHEKVGKLLDRYYALPEWERFKKGLDPVRYLWDRVMKSREALERVCKANREMEVLNLFSQLRSGGRVINDLNTNEIRWLMMWLEEKAKVVKKRQREWINAGGVVLAHPPPTNQVGFPLPVLAGGFQIDAGAGPSNAMDQMLIPYDPYNFLRGPSNAMDQMLIPYDPYNFLRAAAAATGGPSNAIVEMQIMPNYFKFPPQNLGGLVDNNSGAYVPQFDEVNAAAPMTPMEVDKVLALLPDFETPHVDWPNNNFGQGN